jgi:hypothetical protein
MTHSRPDQALRTRRLRLVAGGIGLLAAGGIVSAVLANKGGGGGGGGFKLPTTKADFFMPGTQPSADEYELHPVITSQNCTFCHSDYSITVAPFDTWVVSLMGQSARDPVWHAALTIANQDANVGGETCIRCHAPGAWLGGRSETGTLDDFVPDDYDGVTCNACHRLVDPTGETPAVGYPEGDPDPDTEILSRLAKQGLLPTGAGNARYVIDPKDSRRGPFDDIPMNLHGTSMTGEMVPLITSPWHAKSEFCGTCHDVSNPVYVLNKKKGTYQLGALDAPHPTQDPRDMYPEQRTYSEWTQSEFATTGVYFPDRRFGGNHPTGIMKSCQDCHMPDQYGGGCVFADFGEPWFNRPDVPQHSFAGANTWVIDAIRTALGDEAEVIGLTADRVNEAKARNIQMLRDASDMELTQDGGTLRVRVVNQSGHKLPTGYPEGRRMWLNVKFLGASGNLVQEIGGYDYDTASLDLAGTKVWEMRAGISPDVAKIVGREPGESFHLALNNVKLFDNRIPPRGFTNAGFTAVQAAPVGATYADGQHWDDSTFAVPSGAARAVATLYYQVTTREYIEFLRDENQTDDKGQIAYDLWAQHGKSAPVDMDVAEIAISSGVPGDLNGDGQVNAADLAILLGQWGGPGTADFDGNGTVAAADLAFLLASWT